MPGAGVFPEQDQGASSHCRTSRSLPIPDREPAVRSIQQPIKAPAGMVSQPKSARLNRLKTIAPMIPCSGSIGGSP